MEGICVPLHDISPIYRVMVNAIQCIPMCIGCVEVRKITPIIYMGVYF